MHCLSALRNYLQHRASSLQHHTPSHSSAASGLSVASLSKEFSGVALACMACIHEEAPSSQHSSGLFSGDLPAVTHTASSAALELLPCIIELLLDFAEEVAVDIVDSLFLKKWPSHMLLTLCNLVCDLIPFLGVRGQHFKTFKVPPMVFLFASRYHYDCVLHGKQLLTVTMYVCLVLLSSLLGGRTHRENCCSSSPASHWTTSPASCACACTCSS